MEQIINWYKDNVPKIPIAQTFTYLEPSWSKIKRFQVKHNSAKLPLNISGLRNPPHLRQAVSVKPVSLSGCQKRLTNRGVSGGVEFKLETSNLTHLLACWMPVEWRSLYSSDGWDDWGCFKEIALLSGNKGLWRTEEEGLPVANTDLLLLLLGKNFFQITATNTWVMGAGGKYKDECCSTVDREDLLQE